MQDIKISDIARSRRITAVAASELKMTPRQSERPRQSAITRAIRMLSRGMRRAKD